MPSARFQMGNAQSSSPELLAQTQHSKEIDKELTMSKKTAATEVKVLLLGSGARTIARQLKMLFMDSVSEKDASIFREIIVFSIVKNMKTLVVQAEKFGYEVEPSNRVAAEEVKNSSIELSEARLDGERGRLFAALWRDPAIQRTAERQHEFEFDDSAPYFFDALERVAHENYTPTTDDVLHVRVKTNGIVETDFVHRGLHFRLVEVSEQRNERKKWIHCFQDVTAIFFAADLSCYDLKLEEDLVTNRMHEALNLFNDVINNRWFDRKGVVLFLNNTDVFEKKIQRVPLTVCFPEYAGPQEHNAAADYIEEKFKSMNKTSTRLIYAYRTNVMDMQGVQNMWEAIGDIFMVYNHQAAGFTP